MSKKGAVKTKIVEKKIEKVRKAISKTNGVLDKLHTKLESEERTLKSLSKDKKVKKSKFAKQTKLVSKLEKKIKKVKSLKKEKKSKLEVLRSKLESTPNVKADSAPVQKQEVKSTPTKKVAVAKKTTTARKSTAKTSSDYGFKEAIAKIRTLTTVAAIDKFTAGETRVTVLKVIEGRKNRVKK